MNIYAKIDMAKFKDRYAKIYDEKINTLTELLAKLITSSTSQKELSEIVALMPDDLLKGVFSQMYTVSSDKIEEPLLVYLMQNHEKKYITILRSVSTDKLSELLSIENFLGISLLKQFLFKKDLFAKLPTRVKNVINPLLHEKFAENSIEPSNHNKRKILFKDEPADLKKIKLELSLSDFDFSF